MTKKETPARTLELQVDVDAPVEAAWKALTEGEGLANWFAPIARVSQPGPGGEVTLGWSEEMTFTSQVDAWEPGKLVRWRSDGIMGPGTVLMTEFQVQAAGGKTRVRLVQSGFGESEGWDDLFEGTKTGWSYFLQNLRLYLERHAGRTRRMISERLPVRAPRGAAWTHIASAATGLPADRVASLKAGDTVQLALEETGTVPAVVELAIEKSGLALRFPDLVDALLFIELEGRSDTFHVGWWLSVYDAGKAQDLEEPARRTFRRIHESLPSST
jgi:uncharacterized protein YndB with AHSA1/START domain